MYLTDLGSNPYIIGDDNYQSVIQETQDGGFSTGMARRDYNRYREGFYAPMTRQEVFPRSKWDDLIKMQDDNQSSPWHWEKALDVPVLDQNGQGYCHTEDTEVLTEHGWVQWPDYDGKSMLGTMNQSNGHLEYQMPSARQVFEYKGEVVGCTNRRLDFAVTPNHRMLVRKWDESKRTLANHYTTTEAKDIGWYAGIPHATQGWTGTHIEQLEIEGDQEYNGDDFVALLGLIVSDGFAGGAEKNQKLVSFASFRDDLRSLIEPIARRCGFHENESRRGVWVKHNQALADWMRKHCYQNGKTGAHAKKVPGIVGELSAGQIARFLHFFDDRSRDGLQFYSVSKRLIDDLQVLHLKIGKRTHIGVRPPRVSKFAGNASGEIKGGKIYTLTVGEVDRLCIDKKKHLSQDKYCGNVFCATVPNGTLVTRRNGSILLSKNCWAYGTVAGVMNRYAASGYNPVPFLSAHGPAWQGKKGRDEGGWAGEAVMYIEKYGIPTTDTWPEKSMNGRVHSASHEQQLDAARHKIVAFEELQRQNFDQAVSCLLDPTRPCPVTLGLMWWGHLVCGVRAVKIDRNEYGIEIKNSWRSTWGNGGFAVLKESKATAHEYIAIRQVKQRAA